MRGKLRDKRTAPKRELFKRELIERKRPRRNSRPETWLDEWEDENIETELAEEDKAETTNKK
jgi:hypothetical protein